MLDQAVENLKGKQKGTFRSLIKMYEAKKYQKGLKLAEKMLKDNPKHAEINVIKALFRYYTTGDHDKCEKEAKGALMLNLKSPFCWNICGMIAKMNKKPTVAAKNFSQALRFDPNNQQILREATNLYLYSRDYQTHQEYRKKMLFANASIVMNWNGFVCANHLVEDYETALTATDSLEELHWKKVKAN